MRLLIAVVTVLAALAAAPAHAQSYPTRPITMIVPFPAGGRGDGVARVLAEGMRSSLDQPVQVENRAGGNTVIGAEYVARARPDGQTLLLAAGTPLPINPVIQPNLPYKVEDFAPVALVATYQPVEKAVGQSSGSSAMLTATAAV